jgi:hypothetical protein
MDHVVRPVTGAAADLPRERTQFKELLLAKHFKDLKESVLRGLAGVREVLRLHR